MNDEIKDLVSENASAAKIREAAVKSGMRLMREDAAIKVVNGYTTIEEVVRVSV
jgi:type II secretory ATPase GspE/PulE/Tfp pilus assembly ATPase PilB-like protein